MSVWSHIAGTIELCENVTEDSVLFLYNFNSHDLKGSEGGLDIIFTRNARKRWSSFSESNYNVEPYNGLRNMVINGSLRDFEEDNLVKAVEALKSFLYTLHKKDMILQASFVLECDSSEYFYYVAYVKGRVRSKKIKVDGIAG